MSCCLHADVFVFLVVARVSRKLIRLALHLTWSSLGSADGSGGTLFMGLVCTPLIFGESNDELSFLCAASMLASGVSAPLARQLLRLDVQRILASLISLSRREPSIANAWVCAQGPFFMCSWLLTP